MRRHIGCKEWETHADHFYQECQVMQSYHNFLAICYNSFLNLFVLNPSFSSHNKFVQGASLGFQLQKFHVLTFDFILIKVSSYNLMCFPHFFITYHIFFKLSWFSSKISMLHVLICLKKFVF